MFRFGPFTYWPVCQKRKGRKGKDGEESLCFRLGRKGKDSEDRKARKER